MPFSVLRISLRAQQVEVENTYCLRLEPLDENAVKERYERPDALERCLCSLNYCVRIYNEQLRW